MSEEMKKLADEKLDGVAGGVKSNYDVARDVIDGRYGNGEERIRRLRAAGYDPNMVQSIVNQILKGGYKDPYANPDRRFPPDYVDPYK